MMAVEWRIPARIARTEGTAALAPVVAGRWLTPDSPPPS